MREASERRTATDTDSYAFCIFANRMLTRGTQSIDRIYFISNLMKFILLSILMLSVFSSYGEYIDRTTALEKGREFMKEKAYCAENTRSGEDLFQYAYAAEKSNIPCFYVFNRTGGGYVIVSADDQISEPILGYSTTGYFCYENLPEDAKYWIDSYADRIAASKSIPNKSKEQDNNAIGKEIPPLLGDLKWNQWSPYNLLCPEIDGILPPTGCVATAMAQIMR